jgi:hypothetical protein
MRGSRRPGIRILSGTAGLLRATAVLGSTEVGPWLGLRSAPEPPVEPTARPFAPRPAPAPTPLAFAAAPKATVGASFQTSEYLSDSGYIPPDTMAAVGPDHVVDLINGNYQVFDKVGNSLESLSLDEFWIDAAG